MKYIYPLSKIRIIVFITCVILLGVFNNSANAQELKLIDFKHLVEDVSARISEVKDVNGKKCALVIIKSNIADYSVESAKGIEDQKVKIGERWLWLSSDEYQLVIRKEGYVPLEIDLNKKLKELETYELILSDDYGILSVEANDAFIWLDNNQIGKNIVNLKLKKGKYIIKATRENYYKEERFVILDAGDSLNYSLKLKPKMGNLIINSFPTETMGAEIFINNILNKQKTHASIPLQIGEYSIRLEKKDFLHFVDKVKIEENENYQLNAEMKIDPSIIALKHKKRKNAWLISSIISAGVGTFSLLQSNKLYNDYQNAGSNATDLRKESEMYDVIYPIAYAVSGFCLIEVIVQRKKQNKANNLISFYPTPFKNGAELSLTYNF